MEDELLMHTLHTLPSSVKKFWRKRYDIFSKYDEGIYMTSELWYSITPECTAKFTAKLIKELLDNHLNKDEYKVIDLCCGGGGNTIQFAKEFERVIAIDINPINVRCTLHNAAIYNVEDKIEPITGDWNEIHQQFHNIDFIYCSPPWGGPSYKVKGEKFDVYTMEPLNLDRLISSIIPITRNMAFCLPRNTNLEQLKELSEIYSLGLRVIKVKEYGRVISLVVIFGDIAQVKFQYNSDLQSDLQ